MEDEKEIKKEEKYEKLVALCMPVFKTLCKDFHPHTSIIMNSDGIRVEETIYGLPTKYVYNDKNL